MGFRAAVGTSVPKARADPGVQHVAEGPHQPGALQAQVGPSMPAGSIMEWAGCMLAITPSSARRRMSPCWMFSRCSRVFLNGGIFAQGLLRFFVGVQTCVNGPVANGVDTHAHAVFVGQVHKLVHVGLGHGELAPVAGIPGVGIGLA